MVMTQEVIYEYEDILMGKRKNFGTSLDGNKKEISEKVGAVWKYAVVHLLKWTPQQAVKYLTYDIVKMLCLDKTFNKMNFKPERTYIGDFRLFLQYAFPDEVRMGLTEQTISEYERIAKIGKWANDQNNEIRYPKKFFTDESGMKRAAILLNHVISLYLSTYTIEELYDFFANKKKAIKWLREKSLEAPCKDVYDGDTLEYFHFSLPFYKQNYLYYSLALINEEYQKKMDVIKSKERAAKKKINLNKVK